MNEAIKQCFFLTWAKDTRKTGVAFAPDDTLLAYELADILKDAENLPFELELREGELQDYLGNSLAWPLMSPKMKELIETHLTGFERISWLTARVKASGKFHAYYVPKFNDELDVLDHERTKFVKGTDHIMVPCFSSEKIKKFRMFPKPGLFWRITRSIYVDDFLRRQIGKAGVSGVAFEKAATSIKD